MNKSGEVRLTVRTSLDKLIDIPGSISPFIASLVLRKSDSETSTVLSMNGESYTSYDFIHSDTITKFMLGSIIDNTENINESDFFDGEVAEFIVFDKVLTKDEYQIMNQYLENKWGIETAK
jgi:hypothetical protein